MTISGQKQLSPWPIGERAATVERMVLQDPRGSDDSPYETLCGGSCCSSFQVMQENGSLPGNAPQQLPQSTNDLEACTLPTFQPRANHYSASPSVTSNTQSARFHRMPNTRSQRTQSPNR